MLAKSWRDCSEWKDENLSMNTCSNEAAKFFDITLSQFVTWHENQQYGGLEGSINKMLSADNDFVLGHVLKSGLDLIGSSNLFNQEYAKSIKSLIELTKKLSKNLTKREIYHVEAIKSLFNGDLTKSCVYWENILIENPNDMMAIKFAHLTYFYLGQQPQMRDSTSRVIPFWKSSMPLYSFLQGMHSFGLVQTNFFTEAKETALKALEMNVNDAWATHTICHYNEYKNEFEAGIKFLRETESEWSVCNMIAPHNYWHLSLYHIEKNEHQAAIDIFDERVSKSLQLNKVLDIVDLISFLYRLKLDGCQISLKERWSKLKEAFKNRTKDHGYTFNDAHILILLNACGDISGKDEFFKSLNEYLDTDYEINNYFMTDSSNNIVKQKGNESYLKTVNRNIGVYLFEALCFFEQKEYNKVVDILRPIRYELVKIGGSNAQRDIFHQILVQSALLSDSSEHKKYGLALINERLALKPNSNLTKRIFNRFSSHHF